MWEFHGTMFDAGQFKLDWPSCPLLPSYYFSFSSFFSSPSPFVSDFTPSNCQSPPTTLPSYACNKPLLQVVPTFTVCFGTHSP